MNAPLQLDPWMFYYRVQELGALANHRQSPDDDVEVEDNGMKKEKR